MGSGRLRIRLDDGEAWGYLQAGQYVVFLADCQTDVLLDANGSPATGETSVPVFDNLAAAEEYGANAVAATPKVCASIYDHHGRGGDPVRRIYHESARKRYDPVRSARRYIWAGAAFLCAFAVWAIFGMRSDERFFWFYLLGLKFFTVGTVLLVRGIGFFLGRRSRG